MAKHRWSILCRRAVVDKFTNQLSILETIHEFALTLGSAENGSAAEIPPDARVPLDVQLVSLWSRDVSERPEVFWTRLEVKLPNGEVSQTQQLVGSLEGGHRRTRLIYRIPSIPFSGTGTYYFVVSVSTEENGDYSEVVRVPLELKILDRPAQASEIT